MVDLKWILRAILTIPLLLGCQEGSKATSGHDESHSSGDTRIMPVKTSTYAPNAPLQDEVEITSQTRFTLYGSPEQSSKRVALTLLVDSHEYQPETSYRKFLNADRKNSPEYTLAQYLHLVRQQKGAAESFALLFHEEKEEAIEKLFKAGRDFQSGVSQVLFVRRYDVGKASFITASYKYKDPLLNKHGFPGWTYFLEKKGNRFFMSLFKYHLTPVGHLIYEIIGKQAEKGGLKGIYKYSVRVPGPTEDSPIESHPLSVHFNGTVYNTLVNSETKAADAIARAVKTAMVAWRLHDYDRFRSLTVPGELKKDEIPFLEIPREKLFIRFVQDYGHSVAVFLEDRNSTPSPIILLTFWRNADGDLKLTEWKELSPGNYTFDPEVRQFLSSKIIQEFIRGLPQ